MTVVLLFINIAIELLQNTDKTKKKGKHNIQHLVVF